MKPLLRTVVAVCLLLATHAHPENIEEVKELPQSNEPVVEAEESAPQARVERCSSCSSKVGLDLKSPKDLIGVLQTLPAGEVHTQQSFEGCTSSKGCAGIKLQDGKVTEKFGNLNAFGGENAFKAGSNFGSNLLNGKISGEPLWWMGANSPFKNVNSESYQSKTSSSYTSSIGGASGAGFGSGLDLSKNAFLNSNLNGFASNGQSKYQSASSSFQSAQEGGIDIANNPFLNGNINLAQNGLQGGQGFVSGQGGGSAFGAGSQSLFTSGTADKFASGGYGGSSPRPFASSTGSNVNLIQNEQKANEYGFDQYQQTIKDESFGGSSNVNLQAASGGDLQQTCASEGYTCVLRPQCSNGVVNTNGAGILQARNGKQYCNTRTEVCCRLPNAGASQGVLGVGFGSSDVESQGSGLAINTAAIDSQSSYGAQSGFNAAGASNYNANGAAVGSGYGSTVPVVTAIPAGSTGGFGVSSVGSSGSYGSTLRPSTAQNNFVENDAFGSQSENTNVYRPGAVGTGLKPGIPYLPPVDNVNSGTNIVSSTVVPSTFVTNPRPFTSPRPVFSPRPVTTPRPFNTPVPVTTRIPFTTVRPTYLPPVSSTAAPGYLPPVGEQTINRETFVPSPGYDEGGIILDESRFPSSTRRPTVPVISEIPAGCAAALKCTPIEFCTADGIISNTTVILSRDQDAYRVPLTDCKDLESGLIGKCCRDPFYTDPWPTNQLGKWVPGAFGNDGKYVPDNRGSSNNIRTQVTNRPFLSGSTILNNFRTTKPTPASFATTSSFTGQITPSYNQVTKYGQGQYTKGGVGQVTQTGIGQYEQKGIGQIGVGQIGQTGVGQVGQAGVGQIGQTGVGLIGQAGVGQIGQTGVGQYGVGQRGQVGVGQIGQVGVGQRGQVGVGQASQVGIGQRGQVGVGQRGQVGIGQRGQVGVGQVGQAGIGQATQLGIGQRGEVGVGQIGLVGIGQRGQVGIGQRGQVGVGQRGQVGIGQTGQANVGELDQSGVGQTGQSGLGQAGVGLVGQAGIGQIGEYGIGQRGEVGVGQIGQVGVGQRGQVGVGQRGQVGVGQRGQVGIGQVGQANVGEVDQSGVGQIGQSGLGQAGVGLVGQSGVGQVGEFGVGQRAEVGVGQVGQVGVGQRGQVGIGQRGQVGVGQRGQVGIGQIGQVGVGQIGQDSVGVIGQGDNRELGQAGVGAIGQVGVGQYGIGEAGQYSQNGVGQYTQNGVGQYTQNGVGKYGRGQIGIQGQGQIGIQGQGIGIEQGGGAIISQGQGQLVKQGVGQKNKFGLVSQGITQLVENGEGQYTEQGVGQAIVQGGGVGIKQGVGVAVSQGIGSAGENEYSASSHRIYLQRYDGSGQCGVKHGQRPYGDRDKLEVDFAEIPWQAMVLLQTNKSLLCGGVISRPDVVLTSASCVDGLEAKNVLVKGGEWKLGIDDEPLPFQIVQVKTIIFHPGYKSGSLQDDVAILYLSENLRLANNIQPICMPESKDSIDAFYGGAGECIVTGWGKVVLQAHLSGSIMHSVNVSLIEPDQCESKLQQDYPHLLDNYNQDSCACGAPVNPLDNICKVDIGSALACTTGDGYYVMQGVYSWDSGCQTGNQLAAFYKFDIEWYEWAIGLTESVTYAQYGRGTKITQTKYTTHITSGSKGIQYGSGVKGSVTGEVNGYAVVGQEKYAQFGLGQLNKGQAELNAGQGQIGLGQKEFALGNGQLGIGQTKLTAGQSQFGSGQLQQIFGQGQISSANFSQFSSSTSGQGQLEGGSLSQFGKFGKGSTDFSSGSLNLGTDINGPISNSFSATYSEKKFFQTEPKYITYTTKPEIVTFTTKPEIVTFTTKPEYFTYTTKPKIITYTTKPKIITYTTKPKIITYTTKPQFITYETSGSGTNPQYAAPGVTFNPSFSELVGAHHKHNAQCKCNENGKK